jgi:hypothetical protein
LFSDISVMTENTEKTVKLPAAVERFVLHWGDMGSQWGVNRSVAQIHALLYLSGRPLTADEVALTLGLARSNVSNSIRELIAWNLIRRVPMTGDRRELKSCVADAEGDRALDPVAGKRLKEMLGFVESLDRWYAQMLTVPKPKLAALIRLGTRIVALLPLGKSK